MYGCPLIVDTRTAFSLFSLSMYVGLDMSLTSPGITILDKKSKTVSLLFIPQRVSERMLTFETDYAGYHYTIRPVSGEMAPRTSSQDTRIYYIVQSISKELAALPRPISVIIEGYAFGMRSSSHSILHELGGALKCKLFQMGIPYTTTAPTSVKKMFANDGRASKRVMYEKFLSVTHIDLFCVFRMQDKSIGLKIPTPIQDIVDSFALVAQHL